MSIWIGNNRSEDADAKIDETEEVGSGDEEPVEPEEKPEGNKVSKMQENFMCTNFVICYILILYDCRRKALNIMKRKKTTTDQKKRLLYMKH